MIKHVRFLYAIMLCVANMIVYALKVNISTTIIGMVKSEALVSDEVSNHCPQYEEEIIERKFANGDYDWTSTQQGLVVSIYFAGYLLGMFPSGYFADRFHAKSVLLFCVSCNALFTLLVPIASQTIEILYALRFFTGLVSAANLPTVNVLVGKWVVYEEKSMWIGIIYGGTSLGTVLSILSSGWIMNYLGWKMVFYIHGMVPVVWCVLYAIFFKDSPEEQVLITEEERQLLINTYGHRPPQTSSVKVPWKSIFTSVPFLALVATNLLGNFSWYFLLTQMPLYMNKMLKFNIKANATITCIPYLASVVVNSGLGKLLDLGRQKGWWSQTAGRKLAVGFSCIPVSIFMLTIAYIGCNRIATVILLCLSIISAGAIYIGHFCNQTDLAPNYAGILLGIANTPGSVSAFVLPALVGALVESGHTFENWRYVFWITVIAQMSGFTIFMIFGTANIQDWNYPSGKAP